MVTKRIFHIAQFKTATRHWVPVYSRAYFSSRQRCVNFNSISDSNLIANDDVLASSASAAEEAEILNQLYIHLRTLLLLVQLTELK